jgi:hypothetical protein
MTPPIASSNTLVLPVRLQPLVVEAMLLERLEHGLRPADAGQYQALSQQTQRLLADTPADEHLDRLLALFPATATLYENMRYGQAGLCRQALEASLNGELAATALIERLRGRPSAH